MNVTFLNTENCSYEEHPVSKKGRVFSGLGRDVPVSVRDSDRKMNRSPTCFKNLSLKRSWAPADDQEHHSYSVRPADIHVLRFLRRRRGRSERRS